MSQFLISFSAFLVAIAILVTVHEFGHFWVARKFGVKVLRFSVGFGKPLWLRKFGEDNTELVVAAVPLGGFVKMLDEREGEVFPEERHRAFNQKPLFARSAIVAAGPLINILFAVLAYWMMFVAGVPGMKPVVDVLSEDSFVGQAGLVTGDQISAVGARDTPTWEEVLMELLKGVLDKSEVDLLVKTETGEDKHIFLDFRSENDLLEEQDILSQLGMKPWRPELPAVIERLTPSGPAQRAGMLPGDRIAEVNGEKMTGWGQWVEIVRNSPATALEVTVDRQDALVQLRVVPGSVESADGAIGRIGAYVHIPEGFAEELRTVQRYGPVAAIGKAVTKTLEVTGLIFQTLWKMVVGDVSVRNISGPLAIADFAGHSATLGVASFLGFLALVSISLGVLNLLPIPVLDGGHLLYYAIEFIKGSSVSEKVQMLGQQVGIVALMMLMVLAFYNDITRFLAN